MKIVKESVKDEFRRDTYWSRIHFESDNGESKATVLLCASHQYLWDLYHAKKLEEVKILEWYESVVKKWVAAGDVVFTKPVHYDVYANTQEGVDNGLNFLRNEVTP